MKNFIIYHHVSGKILRTGYCPNTMFSIQRISSSEKLIEGRANDVKERINPLTQAIEKRGER